MLLFNSHHYRVFYSKFYHLSWEEVEVTGVMIKNLKTQRFSLVLLMSQFSLQDYRWDCWGGFTSEQYRCIHFTDQQDHWSALTLEEADVFTRNDKHRNVVSVGNCVCVRPWMESWCMIMYGCFLHPFMLKRSGRHHTGMANILQWCHVYSLVFRASLR